MGGLFDNGGHPMIYGAVILDNDGVLIKNGQIRSNSRRHGGDTPRVGV